MLSELGPKVQWLESFVTDDKIYCIYIAPDERTVLEHAKRGGFPANRVSKVKNVIDPTTAEGERSNEFHNHRVDGKRIALPHGDLPDCCVLLGLQDVFHFHGLDNT